MIGSCYHVPMQSRQIRSSAAELHCDEVGQGPSLILLHAGVADARSYHEVMTGLADHGHALAYDRRGYGKTRYRAESFAHADDLLAVVDALDVAEVTLVGNSQGGRIAIDFALAHPGRVRAMVLLAPAISGEPEPDALPEPLARLDGAIEAADAAGDHARVAELEAQLWLDGPRSPAGRVGGAARELFLDMNGIALRAEPPGEERPPTSAFERLSELTMPIEMLIGDLDLLLLRDSGQRLASAAPNANLQLLPGVAHLPTLERPDLVRDAIVRVMVR